MDPLTNETYWNQKWHDVSTSATGWIRRLFRGRTYIDSCIHKIFLTILPQGPDYKLIEVGCGGGKWIPYFCQEFGYCVTGIDFSTEGMLLAQKNADLANVKATFILANIFDSDLKEKYDIVFSDGFIEHFRDLGATLSKIADLVNPGGLLITTVPNLTGFHKKLLCWLRKDQEIFESHLAVTKNQLVECYETLGLQEIKFFPIGSIVPKVIVMSRLLRRFLDSVLYFLSFLKIGLEGENISSNYLIIGRKP
ncbi:MAG: class I SAM-dependent methyltransferase [Deltaproteobacteria bacterium]|nr:class I SAM-dependent methyltransferase [Deltaproteobacteria bacterium]